MPKIAIVDDKSSLIDVLENDLINYPAISIVFTAQNGKDCLDKLSKNSPPEHPEIILMDIQMPKMDGIEVTRQIKLEYPHIQVVMLTIMDEDEKVFEALKAGAVGYVLKSEKTEFTVSAIMTVAEGGSLMSPSIARKTLDFFKNMAHPPAKKIVKTNSTLLTPREIEILELLGNGLTYQIVADKLYISMGTVKKHTSNIYEKLQVTNKIDALKRLKG